MNVIFNLKNNVYVDQITNSDQNLIIGINKGDNFISQIENSLGKNAEMINLEQLAALNKKLLLGSLSMDISSFCFTKPLFFSIENPLYEINYLVMTVENAVITIKINCSPNMKYLHHELINPLNTIYNAAMLVNLETENSSFKRVIEPYLRIIHNQVDNCNDIAKTFLYNENSYQNINLFLYLKSYLYDYYNSYNYIIEFGKEKLKEYAKREYIVRVPRNIIYFKIILDNIFKNAIFHSSKDGRRVKLDYNIVNDHNCILEITNIICSSSQSSVSSNKLLNISQSHYVGMELISKLCSKMSFKWNLVQNNDLITFTLDIPLVVDATVNENHRYNRIWV
jgi:hypothetical protein